MVRRGRSARGDRAPRQALRPRRRLAPRGGRELDGDRRPRGRGAPCQFFVCSLCGRSNKKEQLDRRAGLMSAIEVIEPATEQVMAEVPRAGVEEVDAAVARAKAAFPAWRAVAPADRARLLRALADAIEARAEDLATMEARNAGKPIGDARGETGMV